MILFVFLLLAITFLAYANGANDNFKGVATLFGSDTTNYKIALGWATATTFLGALASVFLAGILVTRFSGKGLVPDAIAASPAFLLAVALGAGLTVILATVTGFPISTTHSLTGALVGSGLVAVGTRVNFSILGTAFFLPLLVSPLLAMLLAAGCYLLFRRTRRPTVVEERLAYPGEPEEGPMLHVHRGLAYSTASLPTTPFEEPDANPFTGAEEGVESHRMLDAMHYASAGVVSFARGLNDTPKIVALLLVVEGLRLEQGMLVVAVAMAVGGLLNARKIAETMSKKITPLTPKQGFAANMVTGFLVVVASRFGMPVSTTHVSVGSIFGIGLVTKEANPRVVSEILSSWVITLPVAMLLSALVYWMRTVF